MHFYARSPVHQSLADRMPTYDTHYTERYMGLPADNPAGYRESAVFDHVPNMCGELMIVHGRIDENVYFRHTVRSINPLVSCGKDYMIC